MPDPSQSTTSLTMTRTYSRTRSLSRSLSRAPTLDSLTLAHILNGETCPPISFPDFAAFVTHKEFTTENLLFVIWFRSYRHRYDLLAERTKRGVPVPSTRLGDRYSPFAYLDKEVSEGYVGGRPSMSAGAGIREADGDDKDKDKDLRADFAPNLLGQKVGSSGRRSRRKSGGTRDRDPAELYGPSSEFRPCAWAIEGNACNCGDPAHSHGAPRVKKRFSLNFGNRRHTEPTLHGNEESPISTSTSTASTTKTSGMPIPATPILRVTSLHPNLPPPGTALMGPADQPMRVEAERAFATFLRKGGSRELGISDDLREFAKVTLKRSTAPECFLPIYEEIYHTVETQSLPHFLSQAKMNINRPKQLYWYFVGALDIVIGSLFFILLTLFLPTQNYGYRLTRLPSLIFTSFGAMQFYSALRGFCSQVWGRASRQVRPWELDNLTSDEEAGEGTGGRSMGEVEGMALRGMTGLGLKGLNESEVSMAASTSAEGLGGKEVVIEEVEMTMPAEVHPMSDFVGSLDMRMIDDMEEKNKGEKQDVGVMVKERSASSIASPISSIDHARLTSRSPTRNNTDTTTAIAGNESQDDLGLTEVQLRQLAIRRNTVKVPAAELAFPIPDVDTHTDARGSSGSPTSPVAMDQYKHFGSSSAFSLPISPVRNNHTRTSMEGGVGVGAISPFADRHHPQMRSVSGLGSVSKLPSFPRSPIIPSSTTSPILLQSPTMPSASGNQQPRARNVSGHGNGSSKIPADLSALLLKFRRVEPADPAAYQADESTREKSTRVFGPERLVEDPRVRMLMDKIVKEILLVGGGVGFVTVVLCFAVPMRL